MALIESLISQITDQALREALSREVGDLKKRLNWGLVFERHIPESTRLLSAPIRVGTAVWERLGHASPLPGPRDRGSRPGRCARGQGRGRRTFRCDSPICPNRSFHVEYAALVAV